MSRQLEYYHRNKEARNAATRLRRQSPRGRAVYMRTTCKNRAEKRSLEFDLSSEWIQERLESGCELTGMPFDLTEGKRSPASPSVDRIDASGGYTEDNCRVILWGLNAAFGTWGAEAFREVALAWLGVKEQKNGLMPEGDT